MKRIIAVVAVIVGSALAGHKETTMEYYVHLPLVRNGTELTAPPIWARPTPMPPRPTPAP
jgi:hypothetical protein